MKLNTPFKYSCLLLKLTCSCSDDDTNDNFHDSHDLINDEFLLTGLIN